VLDVTRLTVNEVRPLVPPCEAAFQAPMAHWRLDGKPRTARRYPTDTNCPLPTPEDRWLLIVVYLKTSPRQVVPGRLCGLGQSKAHQGMHVLLVVLRATRRALGEAPTRSVTELAQRLGMTEVDATAMGRPPEEPLSASDPPTAALAPTSPLVATMGPNGAWSAPRIQLRRRAIIAASKRTTRSTTCS
jgi:hypothetical protein